MDIKLSVESSTANDLFKHWNALLQLAGQIFPNIN